MAVGPGLTLCASWVPPQILTFPGTLGSQASARPCAHLRHTQTLRRVPKVTHPLQVTRLSTAPHGVLTPPWPLPWPPLLPSPVCFPLCSTPHHARALKYLPGPSHASLLAWSCPCPVSTWQPLLGLCG